MLKTLFATMFFSLATIALAQAPSYCDYIYNQNPASDDCNCDTYRSVTWGNYCDDFNCYMYVRAYFGYGQGYPSSRSGVWVPTPYEATSYVSNMPSYTIANDGFFTQTSDPTNADVILYVDRGHAAVLLDEGCMVSKINWGSEIGVHGFQCIWTGDVGEVRYYKISSFSGWNGSPGIDTNCLPEDPPDPVCEVTDAVGGQLNGGPLYTYNTVSQYGNGIVMTDECVDHWTFQRVSGNSVYEYCITSNCSSFYVYLNTGQSASYQIKAFDASNTQLAQRTVTLNRTSGGGWFYRPQSDAEAVMAESLPDLPTGQSWTERWSLFPNPVADDGNLTLDIDAAILSNLPAAAIFSLVDMTGRTVYRSPVRAARTVLPVGRGQSLVPGVYQAVLRSPDGQVLQLKRLVVQAR